VVAIFGAVEVLNLQHPRISGNGSASLKAAQTSSEPIITETPNATPKPDFPRSGESKAEPGIEAPAGSATEVPPGETGATGVTPVTPEDLGYLSTRNLLIPVMGVKPSQLHDTFDAGRSGGRRHEAIDIMAPQGTPVLATTDGTVIKLFQSALGGTTLYELDPSGRYDYYYAHLMRYADGIAEGKQLKRGEVIAYVGDTGDAGPGNFHLHFSISKITSPHRWSGGLPINPYPLLAGE